MRALAGIAIVVALLGACATAPAARPQATRTLPTPIAGGAATSVPTRPPSPSPSPATATSATVELEKGGSFTIQLRPDKAPGTVSNFVQKARSGFYDGLSFHRVVPSFVVQGGDPFSKSGQGPVGTGGGTQPTELNDLPFTAGAVGVARGNDIKISNASQWFVVTGDAPHLNGQYTNFGRVTSGMDVVLGIAIGDRIKTIRGP